MQKIRVAVTALCLLVVLQVANPQKIIAEGPVSAFTHDYARLLIIDTMHTLTAPGRWGREEWGDFLLYTASIGGVMLLDKPIYKEMQRNRAESIDGFARSVQSFGSYNSFGIMGGFYITGALLDNNRAKIVAMDAFASSLISAGMITTALKVVVGRSRPDQPDQNEEAYHFRPFGGEHSFPSGHTTQAFSLASVIAEHYDERWIDITSYGIATLVGLARIEQEAHFPSDVMAGAIIGTLVGKTVVRYNKRHRAGVILTPPGDGKGIGVHLKLEF